LAQEEARLNLETEIAKAKAKDKVFADIEADVGYVVPETNHQSQVPPHTHQSQVKLSHEDNTSSMHDFIKLQQQQNEIIRLFETQQQRSMLPQLHVPVFDGKPIEYQTFIHAFENVVEAKTTNSTERLHYLEQYTSGEVKELVRSCYFLAPHLGYAQARILLQKKYGDKYRIATAYIEKALSWPEIRINDAQALHRFSVFLTSCSNAMQGNRYLDKFEHLDNIKKLIMKLHYNMRDRWRRVVYDIMEACDEPVVFSSLVDFVDREARIATSPIFGKIDSADKPRHNSGSVNPTLKPSPQGTRTSSLATQVQSNDSEKQNDKNNCTYCNGANHSLENCYALRKKPYKE